MFNTELFEKRLATSWLGRSFYFFEELPSTNSYAKKMNSRSSSLHGAIILADSQMGGRGQYERKWNVSPGQNLTFSIIFEPQKAERFTLLTLACALAVSDSIKDVAGISTKLKWPNDIMCADKKLCGILTEAQFSGNKLERVIVGTGLNVNQAEFGDDLKEIATSLRIETSKSFSREELLADILQKTEHCYRLWNEFNPALVRQINREMAGYGDWIHLLVNNKKLEGEYKFLGVNEAGALVALNKELDVHTFSYEQVRVQL